MAIAKGESADQSDGRIPDEDFQKLVDIALGWLSDNPTAKKKETAVALKNVWPDFKEAIYLKAADVAIKVSADIKAREEKTEMHEQQWQNAVAAVKTWSETHALDFRPAGKAANDIMSTLKPATVISKLTRAVSDWQKENINDRTVFNVSLSIAEKWLANNHENEEHPAIIAEMLAVTFWLPKAHLTRALFDKKKELRDKEAKEKRAQLADKGAAQHRKLNNPVLKDRNMKIAA
jgi:hypothetical protein